jgi:hypothetical protein
LALYGDRLAAEVVPGLDALVIALVGVEGDTRGEVVDEVHAGADLLAGLGVDAFLTVLGVGHGRHGHVVPLGRQAADEGVEGAVLELELDAELLAHRGGDVGVDADDLARVVLVLHRRVRDVRADTDDTLAADLRGKLVGQRGRTCLGAARVVAVAVLGLVTAAGEQQGARDRDRSDRGCPGAQAGRTTGGACGHGGFLRRDGWSCRWVDG